MKDVGDKNILQESDAVRESEAIVEWHQSEVDRLRSGPNGHLQKPKAADFGGRFRLEFGPGCALRERHGANEQGQTERHHEPLLQRHLLSNLPHGVTRKTAFQEHQPVVHRRGEEQTGQREASRTQPVEPLPGTPALPKQFKTLAEYVCHEDATATNHRIGDEQMTAEGSSPEVSEALREEGGRARPRGGDPGKDKELARCAEELGKEEKG